MNAAVVHSFQQPPRYEPFPDPQPGEGETLIRVRAAALTPLVKAQVSGQHSSSTAALPVIPGADGVGLLPDGRRVYFAFPRPPSGSMAEFTAVRDDYCLPVPGSLDDVTVAALANPGMSSWAALRRASFRPGEAVLINGATGVSGRLAVQIARYLGAGHIVATGRNPAVLDALSDLGADTLILLGDTSERLTDRFREVLRAQGVTVILDYLWGPSAERLIGAFAGRGSAQGEPRVRFVQIGAVSGPTITLPGAVLRSSGLELLGSGLGSNSNAELLDVIGELMTAAAQGALSVEAEAVPLSEVETAWHRQTDARLVFMT